MKLDFVEGLDSTYFVIDTHDRESFMLMMTDRLPYVATIEMSGEHLFSYMPKLAEVVKENPDYVLRHLSVKYPGSGDKEIITNNRLASLITPDEVIRLFDAYSKRNEIFEQMKADERAYRAGERETHPDMDEPSWVDRADEPMKGIRNLDNLVDSITNEMVRQHVKNEFMFTKGKWLPSRWFMTRNGIFRVASADGSDNHGHSAFEYDEYKMSEGERKEADGVDALFPVQTMELEYLRTVKGGTDWIFDDVFYKE